MSKYVILPNDDQGNLDTVDVHKLLFKYFGIWEIGGFIPIVQLEGITLVGDERFLG